MIFRFGAASLDTARRELRVGGAPVAVEPQVFALLQMLIENRERVVSRDEIIAQVWKGRIVSDAAVASRIKSARQAIGDDGAAQAMIRTIQKAGFRFVAAVDALAATPRPTEARPLAAPPDPSGRPSIAVLPFMVLGEPGPAAGIADALPHDLIAELSRLRWLFVIARGSSFRFRGDAAEPTRVGAALNVDYCLSGVLEIDGGAMALAVELSDTRDGGVVWGERFRARRDGVHELREHIVQSVVNALELQIPLHEAQQARLRAPANLDAWSAYHLGLGQMYRFSREGAAEAAGLFEQAIALEPGFARAHAGLSFTHFERAFLNFTDDAAAAALMAQRSAETSLEHDPLDPFCNLVMGRVSWLKGELEASLPWLDRAIRLNPNYAQAKYARAWTETLMGQGLEGRANADAALRLSPLDPMAYGMFGVRALSHIVLDEPEAAAAWAERAARAPGAHALIEMIAALGHEMNGDPARAAYWAGSARRRRPGLSASEFLAAFPFREPAVRRRVAETLARL